MNRAHILWSALAGLASAVALWTFTEELEVPRIFADEVTDLALHGGVGIAYQPVDSASAEDRAGATQLLEFRARRASPGARAASGEHMLTVTIPKISAQQAESLAYALIRDGQLSINVIRNDTDGANRLCAHLKGKALAAGDARVFNCRKDSWTHGADRYDDRHIVAAERAPLENSVASALAGEYSGALEPNTRMAFERVERQYDDISQRMVPTYWQTHVVETEALIDHRDIDSAQVVLDSQTQRYVVILKLQSAGAQRFGEGTSRNVGRRLAILMNDTVLSAPVLQSAIYGGRFMITPGARDIQTSRVESNLLAHTLASSTGEPLPVRVRVADIAPIAATVTPEQRKVAHERFGLIVGAIIALLCWLTLTATARFGRPWLRPLTDVSEPASADDPADARSGQLPWLRLLVTVSALIATYYSAHALLPSIDPDKLAGLSDGSDATASFLSQFSVFALGLTPIISAFVLVEICALLVPRWRPLRSEGVGGGAAGRGRLLRAVVVLSIALAMIQGYIIAVWLASLPMNLGPTYDGALSSRADMLVTALTLTGGVMVMWVAAAIVSRHGLGNGLSVLGLASIIGQLESLHSATDIYPVAGMKIVWLVVTVLVVALATNLVLRVRIGGLRGLRAPTGGVVPLVEAIGLVSLLASLLLVVDQHEWAAWLADGPMVWLDELSPLTTTNPVLFFVLLIALSGLFSWLFSRPKPLLGGIRVVGAGSEGNNEWTTFVRATVLSTVYLGLVSWLYFAQVDSNLTVIDLLSMIVATAVLMDLCAEWRMRCRIAEPVSVWSLHQVQATDLVLHALHNAGIAGHARTRYHRALLFFFAPYLPIEIMVARADAERARTVVAALYGDSSAGSDASPGQRESTERESPEPELPEREPTHEASAI